jgi:hypothetical protein
MELLTCNVHLCMYVHQAQASNVMAVRHRQQVGLWKSSLTWFPLILGVELDTCRRKNAILKLLYCQLMLPYISLQQFYCPSLWPWLIQIVSYFLCGRLWSFLRHISSMGYSKNQQYVLCMVALPFYTEIPQVRMFHLWLVVMICWTSFNSRQGSLLIKLWLKFRLKWIPEQV